MASDKMKTNKLEAAEVFTEPLPCPQDCIECHERSEKHSACPQGAQGLFEGEEIVRPKKERCLGFSVESCTDKR